MEFAIAIAGGLTALFVLFTAYINLKKEKTKKPAEDSRAEADSGNRDSISTGDSSDGNISVNSGGVNVTINTTRPQQKKKRKNAMPMNVMIRQT